MLIKLGNKLKLQIKDNIFNIYILMSRMKQRNKKRGMGIYMKNIITRKVYIPFNAIGQNIKHNIEEYLKKDIEGKCINEGYIRRDSINIISYSAGDIISDTALFIVMLECLICRPVEGMRFKAVAKNITKAGIKAEIKEKISPMVIFIARDHHYKRVGFSKIEEGDDINVRVIGIRYELNDEYISIIGELVEKKLKKIKPKIIIQEK
jgi:DNA-directed RNA polymerase subunit E'/Rpb7